MDSSVYVIKKPSKEESIKSWIDTVNNFREVPMSDQMVYSMVKNMLNLAYNGNIDKDVLRAVEKELNINQSLVDRICEFIGNKMRR